MRKPLYNNRNTFMFMQDLAHRHGIDIYPFNPQDNPVRYVY